MAHYSLRFRAKNLIMSAIVILSLFQSSSDGTSEQTEDLLTPSDEDDDVLDFDLEAEALALSALFDSGRGDSGGGSDETMQRIKR